MNKTYKVRATRSGALQVVSELTSSVRAMGTKTVIAAAVGALMAGAAVATETDTAVDWTKDDVTIETDVTVSTVTDFNDSLTIVDGGHLTLENTGMEVASNKTGAFSMEGGKLTINGNPADDTPQTLNAQKVTISGGEVSISGGTDAWAQHASLGGYETFKMEGGKVTLGDNARLWIGNDGGEADQQLNADNATSLKEAMVFAGGEVHMAASEGTHAMIGTMVNGNWSTPAETPKFIQALSLEGTKLFVDRGEGALLSRDIDLSAGSISVADGATLHVLAQKLLNASGGLDTDTTDFDGNFTQTGGSISVAEGGTLNMRTALTVEGGEFTNAGVMDALSITIKDGTFRTVTETKTTGTDADKKTVASFAAEEINLEGGQLVLTNLNSSEYLSLGNEKEEGKDYVKDQYLITGQQTLNLMGGELVGAPKVKVGAATKQGAGALNVKEGSYAFSAMTLGTFGTVTTTKGAKLEVGTLNLTSAGTTADGQKGSITNDGTMVLGTVKTTDTASGDYKTELFENNGTLETSFSNLAKKTGEGADAEWSLTTFGSIIGKDSGKIVETGYNGDYDLTNLADIREKLGLKNFNFANATLVAAEGDGDGLTFQDVIQADIDLDTNQQIKADVKDTTASINMDKSTNTIRIGSVDAVEATTLAITGTGVGDAGSLTIGGTDGELFAGSKLEEIQLTGKVTLGVEGTSNTINQHVVIGTATTNATLVPMAAPVTDEVTIAGNQQYKDGVEIASTTSKLVIADTAAVDIKGGLTFGFEGSGNPESVAVAGDLTVDWMEDKAGTVVVKDGGAFALLGSAKDAAAKGYEGSVVLGMIGVEAGTGQLMSFGATLDQARQATAQYQNEEGTKNILYVAKQIDNNGHAIEIDGAKAVLDLSGIASTAGWEAQEGVVNGSFTALSTPATIHLQNLTGAALVTDAEGVKSLRLGSGEPDTRSAITVDYGTIFYGAAAGQGNTVYGATLKTEEGKATSLTTEGKVTNGSISFAPNEGAFEVVEGTFFETLVRDAVENVSFGQNDVVDAIVFGIDDQFVAAYNEAVAAGMNDADAKEYASGKIDAALGGAENAALMGVLGGAFNVALDANAEVTKSLDRRMSVANGIVRAEQGINAWVDVIGTTNEAKKLYGSGYGYEADLYGAVLGADWTAPCGAILGAAVSVGTGDANSVGQDGAQIDNDVDFYGFSVYGSHQIGNFNGKIDLGYISTSNDLSTHVMGSSVKESLDADVFTIGLGAEYLAKAGSVNVVPHAGIRWSKIDLDDGDLADYDTMNLWQMPVGVTFSGTIESAGWTFAPTVDLSVVPAFGDKDAVVTVGGYTEAIRVVDTNPIQATFGLSANQGAWTFGVNYGLTAGSDERMNNAFNATAKYSF